MFKREDFPNPSAYDYAVFLLGVAAYKAGHARKAPSDLATGPDSDTALWLAGYDSERDEEKLLRKFGCMAEEAR